MALKSSLIELARGAEALAARGVSLLPGSSAQFGPPRRCATTLSVGKASGVVRHDLIPARTTTRAMAEMADPPLDRMLRPELARTKEIFVAEIPQGRYWGRFHGYIIDRNDTLLTDLSPTFTPEARRHDALNHLRLPPMRELRGSVAAMNTVFGYNFHHWLLEAVPRFEWLRRAGFPWTEFDHYIFPRAKLLRHHLETIELLGIDPAKIINSSYGLHLRADRLVVPAHTEPADNHWTYDYTPEGLRFVRDFFLRDNPHLAQPCAKRILVSRENAPARRLVQGERTQELLGKLGFEKVLLEDHSLREQAAIFRQADAIVMPTGGNLANLVFCRPGTLVFELFSPNYTPNFTHALLAETGLRYHGLVADKVARPHRDARLHDEDIDFDPDRLAALVGNALAKFPPPS